MKSTIIIVPKIADPRSPTFLDDIRVSMRLISLFLYLLVLFGGMVNSLTRYSTISACVMLPNVLLKTQRHGRIYKGGRRGFLVVELPLFVVGLTTSTVVISSVVAITLFVVDITPLVVELISLVVELIYPEVVTEIHNLNNKNVLQCSHLCVNPIF